MVDQKKNLFGPGRWKQPFMEGILVLLFTREQEQCKLAFLDSLYWQRFKGNRS
jgi:hypothetical protein